MLSSRCNDLINSFFLIALWAFLQCDIDNINKRGLTVMIQHNGQNTRNELLEEWLCSFNQRVLVESQPGITQ